MISQLKRKWCILSSVRRVNARPLVCLHTVLKSSASSKMKLTHLVCALSLSSDILKRQCVFETLQGPAQSCVTWLTAVFLNISNKNLVAPLALFLAISQQTRACFSSLFYLRVLIIMLIYNLDTALLIEYF